MNKVNTDHQWGMTFILIFLFNNQVKVDYGSGELTIGSMFNGSIKIMPSGSISERTIKFWF
jgi:hypothetical protein